MMEELAKFLYEVGLLKRMRRSGWWVAGIRDPESVAEHTFRTAILGYILARLEGADPLKTAMICLIHDLPETRIGDLHRVNDRYLDSREAQKRAWGDQLQSLPEKVADALKDLYELWDDQNSLEAKIARDADLLECFIQALEYRAQGCSSLEKWIEKTGATLKTETARSIARACQNQDPKTWWHDLDPP
jgi:putative hydrolase of HD superfamily